MTLRSWSMVRLPRVPQIMQMEAVECGAACLDMICAYYGKWIPLERVRLDCGVSRDGSSALQIIRAARGYGLEARGIRTEPDALRDKGSFPCIVHWELNHFVVLRGFKGGCAYLNDPACGDIRITLDEFDRGFTGVCLQLTPGPGFVADGEGPSVLAFARARLGSSSAAVLFAALACAAASAALLLNPVLAQAFTDALLRCEGDTWMRSFAVLFALAGFVQIALIALNERHLLRIQGKLAVSAQAGFMWKLLNLPIAFFSQRGPGDLAARAESSSRVSKLMVRTLAPLAIDAFMLVLYLVLMVSYSPLLAVIGLSATVLNLVLARIASGKRVNIARAYMRDRASLDAATVTGVDLIETIKAAGAEDGYFQRWSGYQAAASNRRVAAARLDATWGVLPQLFSTLADIAVLACGAVLVLDGSFTMGAVVAFRGFLGQFSRPANALAASAQDLFEMRADMERIQDVMGYEDDPMAGSDDPSAGMAAGDGVAAATGYGVSALDIDDELTMPGVALPQTGLEKLRGSIELRDVTFGYTRHAKPLIEHFDLRVEPGKSVALVGASGCGKSTIARLLSGLYEPWEGEVRLGGEELARIPRAVRTGSVAVVDQDIVLFEGTVAENIRLWDRSIEDYEMILAARDAQVHDDIMKRPGGYESPVAPGGANLSGGQRQRIELARALVCDPTILILDEATSALDSVTEQRVMRAICRRGITLVVVAHRLSTVRGCDEIVVLDHGHVVERGAHDELWAANGMYTALVSRE